MSLRRFVRLRWPIAVVAALAAVYLSRAVWMPNDAKQAPFGQHDEVSATTTDKIIVGDQAQQNLGLTAKPLKVDSFWKTINVPGMVVDRPGVSDREVVSPTIGTVSLIRHVPGDMVRPGDELFTLKLSSESLHQTQADLLKASENI